MIVMFLLRTKLIHKNYFTNLQNYLTNSHAVFCKTIQTVSKRIMYTNKRGFN